MNNINEIYQKIVNEFLKKKDELNDARLADLPPEYIAQLRGERDGLYRAIRIILDTYWQSATEGMETLL